MIVGDEEEELRAFTSSYSKEEISRVIEYEKEKVPDLCFDLFGRH